MYNISGKIGYLDVSGPTTSLAGPSQAQPAVHAPGFTPNPTFLLPEHKKYTPNYDGYVVIGAGLPRTGTMSMQAALEKLFNGPCYHMLQVAEGTDDDLDHWEK